MINNLSKICPVITNKNRGHTKKLVGPFDFSYPITHMLIIHIMALS